MISKRGVIDPLHRQVTSIASLEWIKVFFPFISPTERESDCTIRASVRPIWVVWELNHLFQNAVWDRTYGAVIAEPRDLVGTFREQDVTVKSYCFLIYQMWKFIHPFINPRDPVQKANLCRRPQHGKVQERLFYRQSASCAAVRLSLQSAVMEWWMLWRTDRLFFPTSAPCWHAPWLLLIIPRTLLFLKSSQISLLVQELPVIACLIPASDIIKSTREVSTAKPDVADRHFDDFC